MPVRGKQCASLPPPSPALQPPFDLEGRLPPQTGMRGAALGGASQQGPVERILCKEVHMFMTVWRSDLQNIVHVYVVHVHTYIQTHLHWTYIAHYPSPPLCMECPTSLKRL